MPAIPAGRPAARCGSAPTIMPTAVTATTCSAGAWPARCRPAAAARSRAPRRCRSAPPPGPPGRDSRSSSPRAISAPNASAARGCTRPAAAVWATAATSSTPAATTSSSCPESIDCQAGCRARCRWLVTAGPQRLSTTRSGAVGSSWSWASTAPLNPRQRAAAGWLLPAVPAQCGDERLHQHRVELGAGPLAQLGDGLLDPPGAPVGPGRGHRVERVGHRDHPGELGDLVAGQAHRVALAVHPLVVVHDAVQRLGQEADLPDDLQAAHRVQLDGGELLLGQRPGLLQHLGRHAELAHVVQHAGVPDGRHPLRPHADLAGPAWRLPGRPARCARGCRSPWSPPPGRARPWWPSRRLPGRRTAPSPSGPRTAGPAPAPRRTRRPGPTARRSAGPAWRSPGRTRAAAGGAGPAARAAGWPRPGAAAAACPRAGRG